MTNLNFSHSARWILGIDVQDIAPPDLTAREELEFLAFINQRTGNFRAVGFVPHDLNAIANGGAAGQKNEQQVAHS